MSEPLVKIRHLKKIYIQGKQVTRAIEDFSLDIYPGETLGLVGESGCGKSTVARCLLRLTEATSGYIEFDQTPVLDLEGKQLKAFRRQTGMIFQDPYASLNPRMTAEDIIAEPLIIHKILKKEGRRKRVLDLLDLVGLPKESMKRFPHEFSGGQKQRIGIARALAMNPRFIVCDEPISALDVSVQAQIINLLKKLQKEIGLTILFIAHDLRIVKYLSNRIAVMYLGHIVEVAPSAELYENPKHPYTQALLSAIPIPDPTIERNRKRIILKKDLATSFSKGCPFVTRCPHATPTCHHFPPSLRLVADSHMAACHLLKEESLQPQEV